MVKCSKPIRRIGRRRKGVSKNEKRLNKKLAHNGTRVTRTKALKRQVARDSVIRHGRGHSPQFPADRSEPKASLLVKKRVMEYKRRQDALSTEEAAQRDRRRKLRIPSAPRAPPVCMFDHSKPLDEVVQHFFTTLNGEACLKKNWRELNMIWKVRVVAAVVQHNSWNCDVVEMIVSDEGFIRGVDLDSKLLDPFVKGIGIHLEDLLRRADDCCILWNLLQFTNDRVFDLLVDGISRRRSDVIVKCRHSFNIIEYIVRKKGNEQYCQSVMRRLADEVRAKMLLFRNGCVFLGRLVSSYPSIAEYAFATVSLESHMKKILCYPYQAMCMIPLLSSDDSDEGRDALSFVSRVVINAVVSLDHDREALSPHGKQVLGGVISFTLRNRDWVFVEDDEFEKAKVLSFIS